EQRLGPYAERLGEAPGGAGVHTGDHDVVEGVGRRARGLERVGEGLLAEGGVDALPEALLPAVRGRLPREAPALEELLGGGGGADELGDHVVVAEQQRSGAVTPVSFVT